MDKVQHDDDHRSEVFKLNEREERNPKNKKTKTNK